jgi:hypothetical protein
MKKQLQPLHRFQDEAAIIVKLHDEIIGLAKDALVKAIEVGDQLTKVKNKLKHGEWLPWLESNVPFTDRTANEYMRCFARRKQLKLEMISSLADARALIAGTGQRKKSGKSKSSKRKTNAIAGNVATKNEPDIVEGAHFHNLSELWRAMDGAYFKVLLIHTACAADNWPVIKQTFLNFIKNEAAIVHDARPKRVRDKRGVWRDPKKGNQQ